MVWRWMAAVAALVLAAPTVGGAQTYPGLFGRKLLILDAGAPAARKIVVRIVDKGLDTTGMDPVTNGAFLHVFNSAGTSDSACMPLPASGWTATGANFRYRDPSSANGPCRTAILKSGKLFKAVCTATKSPIDYSLNEVAQASVGVRLTAGSKSYCADFGGAGPKDVPNARFRAKNASPPLVCPTPPASCP